MRRLPTTDRREGRDNVLCVSLLLLLLLLLLFPFLVPVQSSVAFAEHSQVLSVRHFGAPTRRRSEVEEIPQLGTWDALTLCIKDSKEERALERWLLCVEAIAPQETLEIPQNPHGSEAIEPKKDVFSTYDELSTLEIIKAQEGCSLGRMELERPNDQVELCEIVSSPLQKLQGRKDGSNGGGLGLLRTDGLSRNERISSLDSIDKTVSNSRKLDTVFLPEEYGHGGFVSKPPDSSPSAINHGASDSDGKSRQDFLSFRADQKQESASDSSDEVDQIPASFSGREGSWVDSQQGAGKDIPVASSVITEALNSCTSGFLPSDERQIVERENVPSTSDEHLQSNLGMSDVITSAAVVGLLSSMLRLQRRRGGRKSENQHEISTAGPKMSVESDTLQIERNIPIDTQKLSETLGMAVAQVLYEVLEQHGDYSDGSLSVDSLSNLLESALKESLMPILGNDRLYFVEKFRDAFNCTYRTRASVRSAYLKAGMRQTEARQVCGKSWRRSQPKARREFQKRQYSVSGEIHSVDQEVNKTSVNLAVADRTKTIPEEKAPDPSFEQGTSCFFSTSEHEQDGRSDCGVSSTGLCLGGNSSPETSQLASCREEENTFYVQEDGSQDEQMYSADESSESGECIVFEGRGSISEAVGRKNCDDDGPSSYHSLGCDQNAGDQGFSIRDLVYMSENPQPSSCSAGGVGSSVDTDWVGSFSSQGIATPRLELSDQSVEVGHYLDSTRHARLNDDVELSLKGLIADSVLHSRKLQVESRATSENSRTDSMQTPERNLSSDGRRERGEGLVRRPVSANSGGNRDRMTPQVRADGTQSSGFPIQDAMVLAGSSSVVGFKAAPEERYDLLERSVAAQEQHNRLLAWDLQRRSQGLAMKQEHLHLQFECNSLMKENVEISRIKAEFRENELQDRKLNLAYNEFSRTCADQLVAGLFVMLVVLGFSFWNFSYDRLTRVVTVCKSPVKETHQSGWLGTNWMYNTLNAFTYQLQALTCEITKAGRMVVGLVIIAFVTSSLLRRSVTSSSQAMPATIIVVVLGGVCGFFGKISIDSLGGSGLHWVLLWESICFLHTIATCFTPQLYRLIHGPPPRSVFEKESLASRISSGIARFIFHSILVFILPFMAGLLPFASPEEIMQMFLDWWSPGTFHGKYRVHS